MAEYLGHVVANYLGDEHSAHKYVSFILEMIVHRNPFDRSAWDSAEAAAPVIRKWVTRLNVLLQSKSTMARWSAICLIKATCEKSETLMMEHMQGWNTQLLNIVMKSEPEIIQKEAIKTLSFLYVSTVQMPEMQREVTTPNLSRFGQTLIHLSQKQELLPVVMTTLSDIIRHFPSNARHMAESCRKLCISLLSGESELDDSVIQSAASCLAALYQAGKKDTAAGQWKDTVTLLSHTIHYSLNRLFRTVDEEFDVIEPSPFIPFPEPSPDYAESFPVHVRRVRALMICLSTILSTSTSTIVSIPMTPLMDLLCRIYDVNKGSNMREHEDGAEFNATLSSLPALHLSASHLFTSMILCAGSHMARYVSICSRIFTRLLEEYKNQPTLKVAVYGLLSLMLQTSCGYMLGEHMSKPLASSILDDISMNKQVTEQPILKDALKQTGRKRKHVETTHSDTLLAKDTDMGSNTHIQLAALDTLHHWITVHGTSMDGQLRIQVDRLVVSRLLVMAQKTGVVSSKECLIKDKLYECLLSSVLHPVESQSSILPHAVRLFSAGLNEQNHQLRTTCRHGLSVCDLLIHPRLPPLQHTTLSAPQITKTRVVDEMPISETAEDITMDTAEEVDKNDMDIDAISSVKTLPALSSEYQHATFQTMITKEESLTNPLIPSDPKPKPSNAPQPTRLAPEPAPHQPEQSLPVPIPTIDFTTPPVENNSRTIEQPAVPQPREDIHPNHTGREEQEDEDDFGNIPEIDPAGPDSEDE